MLRAVRNRLLTTFGLLLALVAGACARSHAAPKPPLAYIERVIGGAPDARLPLLIAIHGLGDTPEAFVELFAGFDVPVRIIAPRAPDPWPSGSSWFAIDDFEGAAPTIARRAERLVQLARYVRERRPTRGRPLVTGFSQGGILSFAVAAAHPDAWQAALPIAGGLPSSMPAFRRAPKGFRVRAFHGREDVRVPYALAERTTERLRKAGTNATLIGFPGVGHAVPPALHERFTAALREELARVGE